MDYLLVICMYLAAPSYKFDVSFCRDETKRYLIEGLECKDKNFTTLYAACEQERYSTPAPKGTLDFSV